MMSNFLVQMSKRPCSPKAADGAGEKRVCSDWKTLVTEYYDKPLIEFLERLAKNDPDEMSWVPNLKKKLGDNFAPKRVKDYTLGQYWADREEKSLPDWPFYAICGADRSMPGLRGALGDENAERKKKEEEEKAKRDAEWEERKKKAAEAEAAAEAERKKKEEDEAAAMDDASSGESSDSGDNDDDDEEEEDDDDDDDDDEEEEEEEDDPKPPTTLSESYSDKMNEMYRNNINKDIDVERLDEALYDLQSGVDFKPYLTSEDYADRECPLALTFTSGARSGFHRGAVRGLYGSDMYKYTVYQFAYQNDCLKVRAAFDSMTECFTATEDTTFRFFLEVDLKTKNVVTWDTVLRLRKHLGDNLYTAVHGSKEEKLHLYYPSISLRRDQFKWVDGELKLFHNDEGKLIARAEKPDRSDMYEFEITGFEIIGPGEVHT